jgi:hypothetical protein
MLTVNLLIAGVIIFILAAVYPVYPRYFRWREELQAVSLFTRQVFFVHCGFIVLLLFLQAALLLAVPQALLEPSTAGLALLVGLTVFWVYRLIAQLFIYDRRLWVGNRLHTVMHVIYTVIWCYLSGVFAYALWVQVQG